MSALAPQFLPLNGISHDALCSLFASLLQDDLDRRHDCQLAMQQG